MESTGINAGFSITDKYGYLNPTSVANKSNENVFTQLLVTQLKNQNPLEPLENNEFIQQMSSLASLEETQNLNANISSLITLQQIVAGQNAFTQSANLVGKYVEYTDPTTNETASGYVDSVHLTDQGLFLSIGGSDVAMGQVTGIISPPDAQDDSGGANGDTQDENDNEA